jgi:hypothetical protein
MNHHHHSGSRPPRSPPHRPGQGSNSFNSHTHGPVSAAHRAPIAISEKLRGQSDVDHVRKVRVAPRTLKPGKFPPKPDIARTRGAAAFWPAPAVSPRAEAAMTAPLIPPLIPPRTRPGVREHGGPATPRRLPVPAVERRPWAEHPCHRAACPAAIRSLPIPAVDGDRLVGASATRQTRRGGPQVRPPGCRASPPASSVRMRYLKPAPSMTRQWPPMGPACRPATRCRNAG